MLPWSEDTFAQLRYWIEDLSFWVEGHRLEALALAALLPLMVFLLRSVRNRRLRLAQLEYESERSKAPTRLPQETLDRNRREEMRYRKESREKGKNTSVKRGSSGPRFK